MIFIVFCDLNFHYIMTLHETIFFNQDGYVKIIDILNENDYSKLFILVDENTKHHCLPLFESKIKVSTQSIEINSGEVNKNVDTAQFLWQKLTDLGADRKSIIINLGGGVITDIGGFVALTFKRGMKFINVPTTLLGMVDAAIGGKTGIDFNGLKNQIGIISPPEMVLIDTEYLKTLPKREFISGMAEIYKYGLIADKNLWELLKNMKIDHWDQSIVQTSAIIKKHIVLKDPQESGLRKILNFGHTLGHAIETHFMSKPIDNQLLHGEAVAVGIILAAHLSYQTLGFPKENVEEITGVLSRIFPKIIIQEAEINEILELLKHDKKNHKGQVNFILLKNIGEALWDCKVTEEQILNSLEYYSKI